ncbi:MAG: Tex family protein [Clostridia bacterium]
MEIIAKLAKELDLKIERVEQAVKMLDEGDTIPFIARYRKEMTGGLTDEELRDISERLNYLRNLSNRKMEVIKNITEQEKLTPELELSILAAATLVEVDDLYRPYRQKKKTKASVAKEKGLEPLANLMLIMQDGDILQEASRYLSEELGVASPEDALQGASDIIAENMADDASLRSELRSLMQKQGLIQAIKKKNVTDRTPYEMYYEFQEKLSTVPAHRVLAMNRGETEDILQISLLYPQEEVMGIIFQHWLQGVGVAKKIVEIALIDGYSRLLEPSMTREIRRELTEKSEEHAIRIFAINLKKLLLQPPVKNKVVLGFDPAYRTGCKLAVVDSSGKVLDTGVIYATPPHNKVEEGKKLLKQWVKVYGINAISIGNGTASRESESFIAQLLTELEEKVVYTITNEAGASVYSASRLAQKEFPSLDVTLRSAISIARRIIDPLAELVKIDPKSIGVGQYQHDVNQKRLSDSLQGVVEDCVNSVGVNVNTASPALLAYVAGISGKVAENILVYREEKGLFSSRKELLKVSGLGPKAYEQAAGFLRVPESKNILDRTGVHPESYKATEQLMELLDVEEVLAYEWQNVKNFPELADSLGLGIPTLKDIVQELEKPGRDPREELQPVVFKSGVMELEDLHEGMELQGVVRNVVDFGAFVDIGVHQDGMVHVSQLSEKFIKNPLEVVQIGDIVNVKVLSVDLERHRVALTMKLK